MKVVITGGGGFLGQLLAEEILKAGGITLPSGENVAEPRIVLADRPGTEIGAALSGKVDFTPLDICDPQAVRQMIDPDTAAVFHLAAIVSAQAEADFDLGVRVNLDGTRNVLEAARLLRQPIPAVFTSSLAVFGGDLPARLDDHQAAQPENSYGAQKAIGEILCGDYRRKGFCDARTLRLPTIIVRPGKPNAAASSFASSILREPLHGEDAICPVARDLKLWVASPETAITGMLQALSISPQDWPRFGTLNLPGLSTSVEEMLAALEDRGDAAVVDRVRFEHDERIDAIVGSWPFDFDCRTAEALGFVADRSVSDIIDAYVTRYRPRG